MQLRNPVKRARGLAAIALLAALMSDLSLARATPITFDFNSLLQGDNSTAIGTFMSGVYGSAVTVTDARVEQGSWSGVGNDPDSPNLTPYIETAADSKQGDFEISFDVIPIVALLGTTRGYVNDDSPGADFVIKAFNSNWSSSGGTRENPNEAALVDMQSFPGLSPETEVDILDMFFSEPVSLLVISDGGKDDVAIDDLTVIPAPEAASLLLLGTGLLGIAGLMGWRKFKGTTVPSQRLSP